MCGFASGGIKTVRLILSPPTWLTNSPIIGVVASTFNVSPSSLSRQLDSSVPLPVQATRINESAKTAYLNIGLLFICFPYLIFKIQ